MKQTKHHIYTLEDIINYLIDNMPTDVRHNFEAELVRDPKLQRTVIAYKAELNKGITVANIKDNLQNTLPKPSFTQKIIDFLLSYKYMVGICSVLSLSLVVYLLQTPEQALTLSNNVSTQHLDSLLVFEPPTDALPQQLIYDKQYKAAFIQATPLLESATNKDPIRLTIGVCEVRTAEYATSRAHQTHALSILQSIQNPNYKQEVLLYSAIANTRLGNTAIAKAQIDSLLSDPNNSEKNKARIKQVFGL
jgi:hypothetical protein